MAVAVVIGILAIAWGVVFVVLALAARSATKDLPDDAAAAIPPRLTPPTDLGLSTDLAAVHRDPYAVT